MVRAGFVALLAPEMVVVTGASTTAEARAWLACHAVDVAIVATRLPDGSGLDLVGLPDRCGRPPGWVLFAPRDGPGLVAEALRRGAMGVISLTSRPEEIVRVVASAGRGEAAFTTVQREGARLAADCHLSQREREVVRAMAAARSNSEIATDLDLSPKTVETYLARLYRRFRAGSRTELLSRLGEEGLDDLAQGR